MLNITAVRAFAVALAMCAGSANAAITFQNLGTTAPPSTMGGFTMQAFNKIQQAAISDFVKVTTIPGSPVAGNLTSSVNVEKRTVPGNWSTWSHAYTGPVFMAGSAVTLTLPTGAMSR